MIRVAMVTRPLDKTRLFIPIQHINITAHSTEDISYFTVAVEMTWKSFSDISVQLLLLIIVTKATREVCDRAAGNGDLHSHPQRCDWFVECSNGAAYVRQCAPKLFFNSDKRVCDFPHLTHCHSDGYRPDEVNTAAYYPGLVYSHKGPSPYEDPRAEIMLRQRTQPYTSSHSSLRQTQTFPMELSFSAHQEPNERRPSLYQKPNDREFHASVETKDRLSMPYSRPMVRQPSANTEQEKIPLLYAGPKDSQLSPYSTNAYANEEEDLEQTSDGLEKNEISENVVSPDNQQQSLISHHSTFNVEDFKNFYLNVMKFAKKTMREQQSHESALGERMKHVVDSTAFSHVTEFMGSNLYAALLSRSAITMMEAIRLISGQFNMTSERAIETMLDLQLNTMLKPFPDQIHPDTALPSVPDAETCPYPESVACDGDVLRLRTFDGLCNNLKRPIIGRMMTPFQRLLPSRYSDGIDEVRRSVTGDELPSARVISAQLLTDLNKPSREISLALVFFGQFVDHDLTRTAITKIPLNDGEMTEVKCGLDGCERNSKESFRACWPIPVPDSDLVFNNCLKFVRSQEVPSLDCRPGGREQLNQVTHWIDASQVYGSSRNDSDSLRDETNSMRGRMAVAQNSARRFKPLLPKAAKAEPPLCNSTNETSYCFRAGDSRVNENLGLGIFHTLFVRHHNSVEERLHRINPHWNGERLYQETRRIVIASLQHIVFNEFLPLVVGPTNMKKFGLGLQQNGYYDGYDASVDARIPNEFSAAAFRFGHSLVHERFARIDQHGIQDDGLLLSQTLGQPIHLHSTENGGIDGLIRGLARNASQKFDWFFTKQLSRSLFTGSPPHGPGHDLMSLNIQRGRDHGLPAYNDVREFCGLRRAVNFETLATEIQDSAFRMMLSKVYTHVDDIDLFVGGVSEDPADGAVVGPTFSCIIATTFRNLRTGDRLFYENRENGFNLEQLNEIRKLTLARIICSNSDSIDRIQPFVFLQSGKAPGFFRNNTRDGFNMEIDCRSIPGLDLSLWLEPKQHSF